jgi:hypothetical protein
MVDKTELNLDESVATQYFTEETDYDLLDSLVNRKAANDKLKY